MAGHPRLRRSKQDVDGRVKPGHDEAPRSTLDDRHRAGPSCGGLLDLHREADDLETGRGQRVEVGELLHVAIADLSASLVPLPDDAGVAGFLEALRREAE